MLWKWHLLPFFNFKIKNFSGSFWMKKLKEHLLSICFYLLLLHSYIKLHIIIHKKITIWPQVTRKIFSLCLTKVDLIIPPYLMDFSIRYFHKFCWNPQQAQCSFKRRKFYQCVVKTPGLLTDILSPTLCPSCLQIQNSHRSLNSYFGLSHFMSVSLSMSQILLYVNKQ